MRHALAVLLLLAVLPPRPGTDGGVEGRWRGEMPVPGQVELEPVELTVALDGAERFRGELDGAGRRLSIAGSFDARSARLVAEGVVEEQPLRLELALAGERLVGTLLVFERPIELVLQRPDERATPAPADVDFALERPTSVALDGLPEAQAERLTRRLERFTLERKIVGLSLALVLAGELADVRSFGWEDFAARIPASVETRYRWASVAKPMTAVVALQLAAEERLDLDADVRTLVPEFPEQRYPVTSRQLLCHQAGIVHYQHMGLRTPREYAVPHPWTDRILSLDMFKESPLLFEPDTRFSYSTPGYVLLGAVIERAGGARYDEQVRARIAEPLGMTTLEPDYPFVAIPHRARGYRRSAAGAVVDSGDDDISWKLPAGGFVSSIADFGRFAAGLLGSELLSPDSMVAMSTRQRTSDGGDTGFGLGIGVGDVEGLATLAHSGGQRKTATYMLLCPERALAVALMCNTEGASLAPMARELLLELVALEGAGG